MTGRTSRPLGIRQQPGRPLWGRPGRRGGAWPGQAQQEVVLVVEEQVLEVLEQEQDVDPMRSSLSSV